MEMMKKYNQEKAVVFNTYQCYLKSAYRNLVLDLEQADRQNFYFGAKLVRGAYMEQVRKSGQYFSDISNPPRFHGMPTLTKQERERAEMLGYEDPINPTYEATTEMYHKNLLECMTRMAELKKTGKQDRIGIMVASHNADTVRFAIEK